MITDPSCDNYAPSEILLDTVGVADIGDVWKNVKYDEKVVFVIHHAERESSVGKETPLTPNGQIHSPYSISELTSGWYIKNYCCPVKIKHSSKLPESALEAGIF